ncbi:MAG: PilZ domain-containing protein [Oligoflexales bacterium]
MEDRRRETKKQAPRFSFSEDEINVSAKTIGSLESFQLTAENVSDTGLLITWNRDPSIPFCQSTILEINIDPVGEWLLEPLQCLGKVVRREDDYGEVRFGINIVQMGAEEQEQWESCVRHLSDSGNPAVWFDGQQEQEYEEEATQLVAPVQA